MLRKFKEIANAWITAANPTPEEKELAVVNMKKLDPLNPDVTATQ